MSRRPEPEPDPPPWWSPRDDKRFAWWLYLHHTGLDDEAPPDQPKPPPAPLPRRQKSVPPQAPPVTQAPGHAPPRSLTPEARRWLFIGLATIAGLLVLWALP